jgi:hypothetical protein
MSESQSASLSQSDLLIQQINYLINDNKNFNILQKIFETNKPLITRDMIYKIKFDYSLSNNNKNNELLKMYVMELENSKALAAPVEAVFKFVVSKFNDDIKLRSNDLIMRFIRENIKDINFNNMSNEYLNEIMCKLFTHSEDNILFINVIQLSHFKISQENLKRFKQIYEFIIKNNFNYNEDNVMLVLMDYFRDYRNIRVSEIILFLERNNFKKYAEFEKLFIESEYFEFKESREIFKVIIKKKHKISRDIIDRRLALLNDKIKNELLEVMD